jgi:hypothetical protein
MSATPDTAVLTAVIPYLYYADKKPDAFTPAVRRHVYVDLPSDGEEHFFHFRTDDAGMLCNADEGETPMRIYAGDTRSFAIFYEDHPVNPATLTKDLCEEAKLERREVDGRPIWFFRVQRKQYVRFTLQDPYGTPLSWACTLTAGGKEVALKRNEDKSLSTVAPLPPGVDTAKLRVAVPKYLGLSSNPEEVTLYVGDLDPPAATPAGVKAAQKILTTLGYYRGSLSGTIDGPTRDALLAFQHDQTIPGEHGALGPQTAKMLVREQGSALGSQGGPPPVPGQDRNFPLSVGAGGDYSYLVSAGAKLIKQTVTTTSEYRDPADHDPITSHQPPPGKALGKFRHFPDTAYIVPGAGNVIRMRARRFVFMDCGRWLGGGRNFGVVWGRHVYLCSYLTTPAVGDDTLRPGLDADFFQGMAGRAKVVNWANIAWANEADFDWDTLHIIIPDLHLMTNATGSVWFQKEYDLQAEIDLLNFARELTSITSLKGKLHVVQVGDSYDLWVGKTEALFEPNKNIAVKLVGSHGGSGDPIEQSRQKLKGWVREIQGATPGTRPGAKSGQSWVKDVFDWRGGPGGKGPGEAGRYESLLKVTSDPEVDTSHFEFWLNPAEKAMRLLQEALGDKLVYLHGNHDNYLILPDVCDKIGLKHRHAIFEGRRVMVEHGHRMEAYFAGPVNLFPHNYDGDITGFNATIKCYAGFVKGGVTEEINAFIKPAADKWSELRDQPSYEHEYARVWLGRESLDRKPPHVFAIGHTHDPKLLYVQIDAFGTT